MIDGELTVTELAYLRRDGQKQQLFLAFPATPIVFQARVNQTFASRDKILEVIFDSVTFGAYTDIMPGMTIWIGSTPGASNIGQVYARKAATSTVIYLGETSEIDWFNNQYITVVQDFGIWARQILTNDAGVIFMDGDVPVEDHHNYMSPFPVFGSDRVVRLAGASVDLDFDASPSWCPGSTIAAWQFYAPGSSARSGMDTATPTITYNASGTYRVSCRVTAANGKISWGHRTIFIWSMPHTSGAFDAATQPTNNFSLERAPHGSYDLGGFDFGVRMLGDGQAEQIRDRQKVILFSRDWYGDDELSIGPLAGSENIIAVGWINGESIETDPRNGTTTFDVQGPHFWMDQVSGPSLDLTNVATAPASWSQIEAMTVDKALAHYLTWRSTVSLLMDCLFTGDTRLAPAFSAAIGSIWQQINLIAARILARPVCDPYGRLFVEIDPQCETQAARTAIPDVMEITKKDRRRVAVRRLPSPAISSMEISSLVLTGAGGTVTTVYSMSNGHMPRRLGRKSPTRDGFLAASQAQSNDLCGLQMGKANNPYPSIRIEMGANNRAIGISPRQYITAPVDASGTPRNLGFNGRIVPRDITYQKSTRGFWMPIITGEAESFPEMAIDGDIPNSPKPPDNPPTPKPPKFPPTPFPPYWPKPPTPGSVLPGVYLLTNGFGIFYTENFGDASPNWLAKNDGAPSDTGSLIYMDIDKLGGILYVRATHGLWYGALGDAHLTQIIDAAWLREQFPLSGLIPDDANNNVGAIGINHRAAHSIIVSAGQGAIGSMTAAIFIGSYAHLQRKTNIRWEINNDNVTGRSNIDFYAGEWLATQSGYLARGALAKYSADGSTINFTSVFTSPYYGFWHVRAGNTPIVYFGAIAKLQLSTDNITNLSDIVERNFVVDVLPACDPTGQFVMAQRLHGSLERSTDFCATWGSTGLTPGLSITAIACIDADRWIVAGHYFFTPIVYYTEDFGATWVAKTGDLATYIPSNPAGTRQIITV